MGVEVHLHSGRSITGDHATLVDAGARVMVVKAVGGSVTVDQSKVKSIRSTGSGSIGGIF